MNHANWQPPKKTINTINVIYYCLTTGLICETSIEGNTLLVQEFNLLLVYRHLSIFSTTHFRKCSVYFEFVLNTRSALLYSTSKEKHSFFRICSLHIVNSLFWEHPSCAWKRFEAANRLTSWGKKHHQYT